MLDERLRCTFARWDYRRDATGLLPDGVGQHTFVLAIDGPMGFAADPVATCREAERVVAVPGRTPFRAPPLGKPYAGFIAGSVRLFYSLATLPGPFRLLGLDGIADSDVNVLEVFPGACWRLVAGPGLPKKQTVAGRQARVALLRGLGVRVPKGALPAHDQLDAAMAAWVAYRFSRGETRSAGVAPFVDRRARVLREGFIVLPAPVIVEPPKAAYGQP